MATMLKRGKEGKVFGPFEPTPKIKEAFQCLQSAFTKALVLAHFDHERPIRLETDASLPTIAGITSQPSASSTATGEEGGRVKNCDWLPIAFYSHTLSDAERNYSVGNKGMLAGVESCRHWRNYLEGGKYPVWVLTDNHNLQRFMKNKYLRGRLGHWWETLSCYDLDIVYWMGKTNSADGLNRRPDYKVAAEAEYCRKETERQLEADWSIEDAHSSAGEVEEGRKKVARISTAQLL
jgi:hypothetical protein